MNMDGEPWCRPVGKLTERLKRPLVRSELDRIDTLTTEIVNTFRPRFP